VKTGKKPPFFSGDFPGISRGIFRGFPGDFFRKKPEFSSIFTSFYGRSPCSTARVLGKTPKFPEKFPGFPEFPGIPGKDFPKYPEIPSDGFSGKIFRIFLDFHPVLPTCMLLHSARSGKNPQISGKVPGDFRNSRESLEKISRNSRKFRPVGFGKNFPEFPEFRKFMQTPAIFRSALD
jgi:hypothetical protein